MMHVSSFNYVIDTILSSTRKLLGGALIFSILQNYMDRPGEIFLPCAVRCSLVNSKKQKGSNQNVNCLFFRSLLWLYSPVYIGPGWKPRRHVYS